MSDAALNVFSGAAGAAIITAIGGIVRFKMERKAAKEDGKRREETQLESRVGLLEGAMMALLLDRIQHLCKAYIKDGSVDADDLRRLHIMHEKYHGEGGNGDLDKLMERVDALPLRCDN